MTSHLALTDRLARWVPRLDDGPTGGLGGGAAAARVPSVTALLGGEVERAGTVAVHQAGGPAAVALVAEVRRPGVWVSVGGAAEAGPWWEIRDTPGEEAAHGLAWLSVIRESVITTTGDPGAARGVAIRLEIAEGEAAGRLASPAGEAAAALAFRDAFVALRPDATRCAEAVRCAVCAADPAVTRALLAATDAARGGAGRGQILPVLAQPAESYPAGNLPAGTRVVLFRSGRERDDGALRRVRTAAAMAYRMIAERCGMTIRTGERGDPQAVEDPYFDGYLANVDPVTFASELRDALPERWTGREFLDRCGGVADPTVEIDEDLEYPIRGAAIFALGENQRACTFVDALGFDPASRGAGAGDAIEGGSPATGQAGESGADDPRPRVLGAQLEQSYLAWRELVPLDPDVDRLITELRRRGPARGVLGARPTWGAWPVAVLLGGAAEDDAGERVLREVEAAYEREMQHAPARFEPTPVAAEVATLG